ncbi:hypothetical protein AXG93_2742s1060 [Marchantia polymorpha subsp. ruderalis]|uniref:Uncharacterized protein n=1 Tax=Marchantia polymorpha subsp. ruderalis TaxID=1480154 RepID=A0A176VG17_MARPO|nr:hypothetical protein AXG93_2742s1060 [Marchantia polymorpha subsp. ruderalis]
MSNSPRMNECLHACKHSSKLPWRHPQMLKRAPRLESIDRSSPIGTPPSAIGSKRASIACKSINRSSLLAPWIRPSSGIGRDESVNKRTRGHRHGEGGERREGEEAMESTVGGLGGEDGGGREGGKGVGGLKQTLTLKGTGPFLRCAHWHIFKRRGEGRLGWDNPHEANPAAAAAERGEQTPLPQNKSSQLRSSRSKVGSVVVALSFPADDALIQILSRTSVMEGWREGRAGLLGQS